MFSESFWKGIIINFIIVLISVVSSLFLVLHYNEIIITIDWINISITSGLLLFTLLFILETIFWNSE